MAIWAIKRYLINYKQCFRPRVQKIFILKSSLLAALFRYILLSSFLETIPWEVRMNQTILLEENHNVYFTMIGEKVCYQEGIKYSESVSSESCVCLDNYFGEDCGVPAAVWYTQDSPESYFKNIHRRLLPRRIIQCIIMNHEVDMFELRMKELGDAVDVYIVGESTYDLIGNPKPLRFNEEFQKGFMSAYHHKIIYVVQDFFPEAAKDDGWVGQDYPRTFTAQKGIRRIGNLRDDDLFFLFDADEIPSREVMMFLKLYTGFDEPINFKLRWTVFGFFWKITSESQEDLPTKITVGCKVGFLRTYLENDPVKLRGFSGVHCPQVFKMTPKCENLWTVGSAVHPAGHHCSWCFPVEDIQTKLKSAMKEDKPRWGDFPEKLDPIYISRLIKNGLWFDDTSQFTRSYPHQPYYAPRYLMAHKERFKAFYEPPET